MIFFIIIALAFVLFMVYINKPKPSSGLVLYFANKGTGKTTYLSKIAITEQRKMIKGKSKYKYIVSNALISGVIYIEDIRAILKKKAIAETLILVDEGSIVYNNRKMNLTEAEISYFKLQRHYHTDMIVVSQSHEDVDVTLRRLYDYIFLFRYMPFFTLVQPIRKKISIDEQTKQIIDEYYFGTFFSWRVFFRPLYYKFFNSWWIPDNVEIVDFELPEFQEKIQPAYIKRKKRFFRDKDIQSLIKKEIKIGNKKNIAK